MTVKETKAFMEEIKAFYPSFPIEEYLINQWSSQLKDCPLLDAKDFFESHKRGSMKEKEPNLRYFVYCFKKTKQPLGGFKCKYCGTVFQKLEEMHECQDLCRTKRYVNKIAGLLELDIEEIFGTKELTRELVDKYYNRFLYKAIVRQKETHILTGRDVAGLKLVYDNVLKPLFEKKKVSKS